MKPSKLDIKWKIFVVLVGFIVVMLFLLWGGQLGFVDGLSRVVTISQLKRTAESVSLNIDNENVDKLADTLSYRNNVSVIIINDDGDIVLKTETRASLISQLSQAELKAKYDKAATSGGSALERESFSPENLDSLGLEGNYARRSDTNNADCHIYTYLTDNADGDKLAVIVEAINLPVSLIRNAMLLQLIVVSALVIGATFLLAYLMSRFIAKPIVSLNISAKELAKGKSGVRFSGGGYKEIEELRDSLNIASKELSEVDRYRQELVANVSHDLKTPLTLIKGYVEMMRDFPTETTSENIQVVIDETERLSGLVNDMLDLSRLQSGGQRLKLEAFDLVELANEIVSRYAKMLAAKGYNFEFQHDSRQALVFADKAKISQVIYNLISNAANYSGADKTIKIREYRRGNNARLDIIDSGEGIDVSALPYIWDRYYKSEKSHRRADAGTGLGLSIVKNVMSLHPGGIYGVESSIGHGSKFYFELPLVNPKK